jgi:hypothetical protein
LLAQTALLSAVDPLLRRLVWAIGRAKRVPAGDLADLEQLVRLRIVQKRALLRNRSLAASASARPSSELAAHIRNLLSVLVAWVVKDWRKQHRFWLDRVLLEPDALEESMRESAARSGAEGHAASLCAAGDELVDVAERSPAQQIVRRLLNGDTQAEIARAAGRSQSYVSKLLSKYRDTLRAGRPGAGK